MKASLKARLAARLSIKSPGTLSSMGGRDRPQPAPGIGTNHFFNSQYRMRAAVGVKIALSLSLLVLSQGTSALAQTEHWSQTEVRLTALLSGNAEQKRTALAEIRGLRSEQASELAVAELKDGDEIVRATAAAAVVYLPEARAARELLPLLDDKQPFVRRETAYALGEVGSWSASERLIRSLREDRDLEVRAAAAMALGKIGDLRAIESLLTVLQSRPKDEEEFLRRAAARSIGQIFQLAHTGTTRTLTPQNFLPPVFKDRGGSGSSPIPLDINSTVSVLSDVLRNAREADDTRREAAYALGAARQPSSTAILRSFANSPDPYLAEIVKEALLKIEYADREAN